MGTPVFSFLRKLHTILHNCCTNLYSHQQCRRVFLSTSSPAFINCRVFYDSHSDWCEVIPHCSLGLHSLIISNVEHLFICFWPSECLLWRNVYLDLPIFYIGLFAFLILSCMSCLYILEINLFQNIFFQAIACLFFLFIVSFAVQKLLSLLRWHLFFVFVFYLNYSRRQMQKDIAAIYVKECSTYVFL